MTRIKRCLARLFDEGQRPNPRAHHEDRTMHIAGVEEMRGLEPAMLEDFGTELARMVLVYPDASAQEMLDALREHVWWGDWLRSRNRKARPSKKRPRRERARGE